MRGGPGGGIRFKKTDPFHSTCNASTHSMQRAGEGGQAHTATLSMGRRPILNRTNTKLNFDDRALTLRAVPSPAVPPSLFVICTRARLAAASGTVERRCPQDRVLGIVRSALRLGKF